MRTRVIICQGCGVSVEAKGPRQKWCATCKREKWREKNRRWRATNPEKYREQRRRWRATNPEKYREQRRRYRSANPEKNRERNRHWHEANPEKNREYAHQKYWADPEKHREKNRQQYWADPEKHREYARIRRARMIALEDIFYANEPARSNKDRYQRRAALLVVARERGWFDDNQKPKE